MVKPKPVFIWEAVKIGNGIYNVYVCGECAFKHTFKNNSWGYKEQKAIEARTVRHYEKIYGSLTRSVAEANN